MGLSTDRILIHTYYKRQRKQPPTDWTSGSDERGTFFFPDAPGSDGVLVAWSKYSSLEVRVGQCMDAGAGVNHDLPVRAVEFGVYLTKYRLALHAAASKANDY